MVIRVKQQKEVTMKKRYINPTINVVKIGFQPLMALSENNPQTKVNHEEYDDEFSSRRRRRDEWADEEEEDF